MKSYLPLTHVTPWENFISIIKDGYLAPRFCRFFREPLLYLNYGRLAYKPSEKESNWNENSPVILFFRSSIIQSHHWSFFPFDTGAILAGRFKNTELNKRQLVKELRYNTVVTNPYSWVSNIYSSPQQYIDLKKPELLRESSVIHCALKEAYNLVEANHEIDYRLTSIECQSNRPIAVEKSFLILASSEKKHELDKLVYNTNKLNVQYYKDKSINGNLPLDLIQQSNKVFHSSLV